LKRSSLWPTLPALTRAEITALFRGPPAPELASQVRHLLDHDLAFRGCPPIAAALWLDDQILPLRCVFRDPDGLWLTFDVSLDCARSVSWRGSA
jgi:hypothetical protein